MQSPPVFSEIESMWYGEGLWSKRAQWSLCFCWIPRKCAISGKWIWLDLAYHGQLMYTGPGDPHHDSRWHDANEHLIWLLKA